MNPSHARRSLFAWMLLAFILLNGLVCSLGHGLMASSAADGLRSDMAHIHQAQLGLHEPSYLEAGKIKSMGSDHHIKKLFMDSCPFASILMLLPVFLAVLSWLLRQRQIRVLPAWQWDSPPLWLGLPALNPRAP